MTELLEPLRRWLLVRAKRDYRMMREELEYSKFHAKQMEAKASGLHTSDPTIWKGEAKKARRRLKHDRERLRQMKLVLAELKGER